MNRFILTIEASVDLTAGSAPLLDILVDAAVVSSASITAQTGVGSDLLVFTLDFNGNFPSSLAFQFNGTSGDGDETITIENVRINGQALNVAGDLTATMLTQGQTSSVSSTASHDHLFGRVDPIIGDFGATTVNGTGGADADLRGTDGADVIDGGGGDDRIRGLDDDDAITGGGGADTIYGEAGNDAILGGAGNDKIFGNEGDDLLHGQADDDRLYGEAGNDVLNGGLGNDLLHAGTGDDILYGEAGNDRLIGQTGSNSMYGDDGDDMIIGGNGDDLIFGGNDNDTLHGANGNDTINGDDGNDFITGGNGIDTIQGGNGNDILHGSAGDDIMSGGNDNDALYGDEGADTLSGNDGNDMIVGGDGADTLNGNLGNDILHGNGVTAYEIASTLRNNPGVVYSRETGSFYQYVNIGVTWSIADAAAQATTLNGVSGHLAVITSQTENNFIQSLLDGGASTWLSGSDDGGGAVWSWTSGPEAAIQFSNGSTAVNNMYENWLGGEPNATNTFTRLQQTDGTWTDRAGTDLFHYVIEWEGGALDTDTGIDTLNGGGGSDHLYGFAGNDILNGGADGDALFGGSGNDALNGDAGNDLADGNDGDDTINGGTGDDTLYGGTGNDTIDGQGDNDTIYGDSADVVTVMEAGRTSVTQANSTQWHTVNFTGTLQNAVVKMFAEDVTGDPFTIRVRNITGTGFEFQLDEYDYQDGSTALETLSWIAVSEGTHTLANGINIEAGFTTATNETSTAITFNSGFTSPVVFSQVSSDNELSAVATRHSNVTGTGFSVQMQEEEANANTHATEDIGWIVMEAGGSAATGMLVSTTGDNVTDATTTINFGGAFGSTPIFIADMQTTDGGDTAGTAGAANLTTTQADIFIDEETSNDAETGHTTENVGYVALNSGTYTGNSVVAGSDILRGGDGDDIIYADDIVDTAVLSPTSNNLLAALILGDNPDAYWDLNETAGTTADNQGSIGAAVDGTIIGGATLNFGALYTNGGTSIDFDGTNDGISIPDDAGINTGTYAERTVELVFNADDVTTRQVLYEEGATVNGLTIYLDAGRVYVTGEDDGDWVDANLSAAVSTGTTYHVAFVFDQPNNSFEGFLNGTSMGSVTVNNAIFPAHSGDIGIGYAPDGVQFHDGEDGTGGYYFNGRISDVALYNTALSTADIQSRANVIQDTPISVDPIDDNIYGGDGLDLMYGGNGGRDVFHFENSNEFLDGDEINGFDVGEQDAIDISDLLTGFVAGVSDINDFVTATTAGSDTMIAVDTNGTTGGANFVNLVQINGLNGIDADFLYNNNSIIAV